MYVRDWRTTLEGRLGKHRSRFEFGQECPTDQDWSDWKNALRTITVSAYYSFMILLGKWVTRSPRIWRFFYDREENCIEAVSDEDGLRID